MAFLSIPDAPIKMKIELSISVCLFKFNISLTHKRNERKKERKNRRKKDHILCAQPLILFYNAQFFSHLILESVY